MSNFLIESLEAYSRYEINSDLAYQIFVHDLYAQNFATVGISYSLFCTDHLKKGVRYYTGPEGNLVWDFQPRKRRLGSQNSLSTSFGNFIVHLGFAKLNLSQVKLKSSKINFFWIPWSKTSHSFPLYRLTFLTLELILFNPVSMKTDSLALSWSSGTGL